MIVDVGRLGTAVFSDGRLHRYALTRAVLDNHHRLVAVGFNPSTATADENDPTIARLTKLARREGCGSLVMLNLFSWRSTDPKGLRDAPEPAGPDYDAVVASHLQAPAQAVVLAWGALADPYPERVRHVLGLAEGHPLWCLGRTKTGQPRHPLYLRSDTRLERWNP